MSCPGGYTIEYYVLGHLPTHRRGRGQNGEKKKIAYTTYAHAILSTDKEAQAALAAESLTIAGWEKPVTLHADKPATSMPVDPSRAIKFFSLVGAPNFLHDLLAPYRDEVKSVLLTRTWFASV